MADTTPDQLWGHRWRIAGNNRSVAVATDSTNQRAPMTRATFTRADAERILARWGWTPERIAALPEGRDEFIATDVPRDRAFVISALAAPSPARAPQGATPARVSPARARALAEIRRVGLGERRAVQPIGAVALREALANITATKP
jgi:hypothetical protein